MRNPILNYFPRAIIVIPTSIPNQFLNSRISYWYQLFIWIWSKSFPRCIIYSGSVIDNVFYVLSVTICFFFIYIWIPTLQLFFFQLFDQKSFFLKLLDFTIFFIRRLNCKFLSTHSPFKISFFLLLHKTIPIQRLTVFIDQLFSFQLLLRF